jgi:DNA-binding XRE family transcriptional regulator
MKSSAAPALPPARAAEAVLLANAISRLRIARHIKQDTAAVRAGLSRNTAYRLERGDPGIAIGHVLTYLTHAGSQRVGALDVRESLQTAPAPGYTPWKNLEYLIETEDSTADREGCICLQTLG